MQVVVRHRYGPPACVGVEEASAPVAGPGTLVVRVEATSVNPLDVHQISGEPAIMRLGGGLSRPRDARLGVDFAGTVTAVGADVTRFHPGDEVFGAVPGAFAQYVRVAESGAVVRKPANVSFVDAACVPVAALTALQGLRDRGHVAAGQHVLINGAAGGVGTFAVQLAKSFGAHVTGVCSTRNVELVRSLGADAVIDYTTGDFTRVDDRFDLLLDVAGSRSWRQCRRVLHPRATVVVVGGPSDNRLLGPLAHVLGMKVGSIGSSRRVQFFVADLTQSDLDTLAGLLADGTLRPVVERTYAWSQLPDALQYSASGHVQGKLAVTVDQGS